MNTMEQHERKCTRSVFNILNIPVQIFSCSSQVYGNIEDFPKLLGIKYFQENEGESPFSLFYFASLLTHDGLCSGISTTCLFQGALQIPILIFIVLYPDQSCPFFVRRFLHLLQLPKDATNGVRRYSVLVKITLLSRNVFAIMKG